MSELNDKLEDELREAAGEIPASEWMFDEISDVDRERVALGDTVAKLEAAKAEGNNSFVANIDNVTELLRMAYERYAEYQRLLISLEFYRRGQEGEELAPFDDVEAMLKLARGDAE